jgi:hypothetical protein
MGLERPAKPIERIYAALVRGALDAVRFPAQS